MFEIFASLGTHRTLRKQELCVLTVPL